MKQTAERPSSTPSRRLPEGWRWVRLGDVCQIIAGQSPPGSTYRNTPDGLPFFQGKADFGKTNPVARIWCVEPTKVALPGDILISVRAPVGPTNIADVKCCIGRGLAAIRCGQNADRDFVLNTLRHFEALLVKKGSGSTFEAISRDDLVSFEIPLPPLAEQQRIAAILREQMAAVETARAAAQARLEAVKSLPAAFLHQVFPQPGQRLLDGWRWVKLGDVSDGPGQYGTSAKSNNDQRGVPVLGMRHIHEGRIRWEDISYVDLPATELSKYLLHEGDLLFNRTNSAELVGKTAVYDTDKTAVFASYLIRFRLIEDIASSHFLSAFINSREGRIFIEENMARAIGQVNISASTMRMMPIPLPPFAEQRRITAALREQRVSVDKARAAAQAELAAINALPAALLRRAFNGEI